MPSKLNHPMAIFPDFEAQLERSGLDIETFSSLIWPKKPNSKSFKRLACLPIRLSSVNRVFLTLNQSLGAKGATPVSAEEAAKVV